MRHQNWLRRRREFLVIQAVRQKRHWGFCGHLDPTVLIQEELTFNLPHDPNRAYKELLLRLFPELFPQFVGARPDLNDE